jgi:hypothetical protein
VAEGVAGLDARIDHDVRPLRDKMKSEFDETRAMIRLSYCRIGSANPITLPSCSRASCSAFHSPPSPDLRPPENRRPRMSARHQVDTAPGYSRPNGRAIPLIPDIGLTPATRSLLLLRHAVCKWRSCEPWASVSAARLTRA